MDHALLVRVLHCLADVDEETDPRLDREPLPVAVLGDPGTRHQFHHEVRLFHRAAVQGGHDPPAPALLGPLLPSLIDQEPLERAQEKAAKPVLGAYGAGEPGALQVCSTLSTATVRDLGKRYTQLLAWIAAVEETVITQRGKAIARLTPKPAR